MTSRQKAAVAGGAPTIQDIANAAILAGKTNAEALAEVLAAFPRSAANPRTISWYRSQLRARGHDVRKDREVKNASAPAASGRGAADGDDLALLHEVVKVLRGDPEQAQKLRSAILAALPNAPRLSALDIFASDLPDEAFEGVFTDRRERGWRETEL